MARINVEDSIYRDERFMRLAVQIGTREAAIGALVFAWDMAARFARSPSGYIPIAEFETLRFSSELIQAGLAEIRDGGVYVKGSGKHCEHIRNVHKMTVEKGRLGGLKSQENRRSQIKPSQAQTSVSSSSSSSSSSSDSKKEKTLSTGVDLPTLARIWNEHRGPLAEVKATNRERNRKAESRWRENPDEHYWMTVVAIIARSPFCNGKNDRGWRATFDWLLQPDTHLKVVEGKYDAKKQSKGFTEEEQRLIFGDDYVPGST